MACTGCIETTPLTYINPFGSSTTNCSGCNDANCPNGYTDAKCVSYNGARLACTGVETNTRLEEVLQVFDEKICTVLADYSTYNVGCLADITTITTEKEFVETISADHCTLKSDFNNFKDVTYAAGIASLNTQITALSNTHPTSSCANLLSFVSSDTISSSLQKLSNALCTIYGTSLDISSVNWDQCYTVSPAPVTIADGFNALLDQICTLKADSASSAITFDNSSSCIGGTTTDSLTTTVNAIKTRLCTTPTLNINTLTWNCTTKPSANATDLQGSLQAILTQIDSLKSAIPNFNSSQFDVTPGTGCVGASVSLASDSVSDNKVASNSADTSPGTLFDKLSAGANITLDYDTTPGKVIVATSGTLDTYKVKSNSGDSSPDFLSAKITTVSSAGITLSGTVGTDYKFKITPTLDFSTIADQILDAIAADDDLKTKFCLIAADCDCNCGAPQDVTVIYQQSTTTTTTTTV